MVTFQFSQALAWSGKCFYLPTFAQKVTPRSRLKQGLLNLQDQPYFVVVFSPLVYLKLMCLLKCRWKVWITSFNSYSKSFQHFCLWYHSSAGAGRSVPRQVSLVSTMAQIHTDRPLHLFTTLIIYPQNKMLYHLPSYRYLTKPLFVFDYVSVIRLHR